jgi:HSP20 family protein
MARERNNQMFFNDIVQFLGPSAADVLLGTSRNSRNSGKFPVDIVNEDKNIYIYAEIPGVNKENIDIDFYNNKLTITVEKNRHYNDPEVSEIKFGKIERALTLPICVTKKETVIVSYRDGVLKIKINKLVEEENKFSVKPTD